ncbi:MAG: hypothetical protein DRH17_03105 [Deltaproteobacteria bacterium]|nr:MAG: hypothetical protein DRH17_03105 [Deltaproteobacteria bacterium]
MPFAINKQDEIDLTQKKISPHGSQKIASSAIWATALSRCKRLDALLSIRIISIIVTLGALYQTIVEISNETLKLTKSRPTFFCPLTGLLFVEYDIFYIEARRRA